MLDKYCEGNKSLCSPSPNNEKSKRLLSSRPEGGGGRDGGKEVGRIG